MSTASTCTATSCSQVNTPPCRAFSWRGLLLAPLLMAYFPASISAQNDIYLPFHSAEWSTDPYHIRGGQEDEFKDAQDFAYCRWGNLMDSGFGNLVTLRFRPYTARPFSNDTKDLFLTRSLNKLERPTYGGSFWPPSPSQIHWESSATQPLAGQLEILNYPDTNANPLYLGTHLMRYLHFGGPLRDILDSNKRIGDSTVNAVILIHGWNPDSYFNAYTEFDPSGPAPYDKYSQFAKLTQALIDRMEHSDWSLIQYHWEQDSDTGPRGLSAARYATAAAEIGHQHGQYLGKTLSEQAPNLRRVHFIVHSAGTWVARAAAKLLLYSNPNLVIQITLLDPFNPGRTGQRTSLTSAQIDEMARWTPELGKNIYRLENYWAEDGLSSDFWYHATSGRYDWSGIPPLLRQDIQEKIDWVEVLPLDIVIPHYVFHSGPIDWYADSVTNHISTEPGVSWAGKGWWASMFNLEPLFTQEPVDKSVPSGQLLTLPAAANTRVGFLESSPPQDITYEWYRNGELVATQNTGAYTVPAAGAEHAGTYHVIARHAGLSIQSRSAVVTVGGAPAPVQILSPVASATLSGVAPVSSAATGADWVMFYADGVLQFMDDTAPYEWDWDTTQVRNGSHRLTASAYGGGELVGTSAAVDVSVSNLGPPPDADDFEPNDSSPLASGPLVRGTPVAGRISSPTDVDWFRFDVTAAELVELQLTVPDGRDYEMEVFGPDASFIIGSYQGTGVAESIRFTAPLTGSYTLRIYGYPLGSGAFDTAEPYSLLFRQASGPPTLAQQPAGGTYAEEAHVRLSAQADGTGPFTYQWEKNGAPIDGAQSRVFTTPALTVADSGVQYAVRISNAYGSTLSQAATLTVRTPSIVQWVGTLSSDWNLPANWSPARVPAAQDTVVISSGSVTIPHDAAFSVLKIQGGSVSVAAYESSIAALDGTLYWSGGDIATDLNLASHAVLRILGPGAKTLHRLYNNGAVLWSHEAALAVENLYEAADAEFQTAPGTASLTVPDGIYVEGGHVHFPELHGTGLYVLNGEVEIAGGLYLASVFVEDGLLKVTQDASVSSSLFVDHGLFTIAGGLACAGGGFFIEAGTLQVQGDVTDQGDGSYVDKGSLDVSGDFTNDIIDSGTFFVNEGKVTIHGSFINPAGRRVHVFNGDLVTGVDFENHGQLMIQQHGSILSLGTYHNISAELTLLGGTLAAGQSIQLQSGTAQGFGTLRGSIVNGGLLFAYYSMSGGQTQTLMIDGDFTQSPSGILRIATTPQDDTLIGRLDIMGAATLAGSLNLDDAQISLTPGTLVEILRFASRTGSFASTHQQSYGEDIDVNGLLGDSGLGLNVSLSPYFAWKAVQFGTQAQDATISGYLADPEADGIPNLLEYALNSDPKTSTGSQGHGIFISSQGDEQHLCYHFRRRIGDPSLLYQIAVTDDMLSWDRTGMQLEQLGDPVPNADGMTETVTVQLRTPLGIQLPKKFLRLEVERR